MRPPEFFPPRSTALLVVDPYNDFLAEGGKLWPHAKAVAEKVGLLGNMRALLGAARAGGFHVFFVPHRRWVPGAHDGWRWLTPTHAKGAEIRAFERGTWGGEFHPDFVPRPGETVVAEHWLHSGFANTDLDAQLRLRGADRVILCGMRANACIEATGRHAAELGYQVTLVKDASAAFGFEGMKATFEVNAPNFAHAVLDTAALLPMMGAEAVLGGSHA